jgi:hypothetical protein
VPSTATAMPMPAIATPIPPVATPMPTVAPTPPLPMHAASSSTVQMPNITPATPTCAKV